MNQEQLVCLRPACPSKAWALPNPFSLPKLWLPVLRPLLQPDGTAQSLERHLRARSCGEKGGEQVDRHSPKVSFRAQVKVFPKSDSATQPTLAYEAGDQSTKEKEPKLGGGKLDVHMSGQQEETQVQAEPNLEAAEPPVETPKQAAVETQNTPAVESVAATCPADVETPQANAVGTTAAPSVETPEVPTPEANLQPEAKPATPEGPNQDAPAVPQSARARELRIAKPAPKPMGVYRDGSYWRTPL